MKYLSFSFLLHVNVKQTVLVLLEHIPGDDFDTDDYISMMAIVDIVKFSF